MQRHPFHFPLPSLSLSFLPCFCAHTGPVADHTHATRRPKQRRAPYGATWEFVLVTVDGGDVLSSTLSYLRCYAFLFPIEISLSDYSYLCGFYFPLPYFPSFVYTQSSVCDVHLSPIPTFRQFSFHFAVFSSSLFVLIFLPLHLIWQSYFFSFLPLHVLSFIAFPCILFFLLVITLYHSSSSFLVCSFPAFHLAIFILPFIFVLRYIFPSFILFPYQLMFFLSVSQCGSSFHSHSSCFFHLSTLFLTSLFLFLIVLHPMYCLPYGPTTPSSYSWMYLVSIPSSRLTFLLLLPPEHLPSYSNFWYPYFLYIPLYS